MANHANYSEEELARYLAVEKVTRFDALFQSKKKGDKASILGETLIYNAQEDDTPDDPSNIKRFWGNTDAGGRWGVYVERYAKFTDLSLEQHSIFVCPMKKGIRKITST